MALKFATPFKIAYDSLLGRASEAKQAESGATEDGPTAASADPPKDNSKQPEKKKESKELDVNSFRGECERHCRRELEARLVALVA